MLKSITTVLICAFDISHMFIYFVKPFFVIAILL